MIMNTMWFMQMAAAVALVVLLVMLVKWYRTKHTPTVE